MDFFWEKADWQNSDPHLIKVAKMPFQRQIPFIPKQKGLYIIRGPRQIGKSSWLKEILNHYVPHEKCFYLSCENVQDNQELAEILRSVRNCKIVLLDEINFVEKWDRAIKYEVDSGHTHILVITGSHAHDLKKGADQMPGRFEGGGEFFLLPMLFDEFCEVRKQAGWTHSNRIDEIRSFFRTGGFPAAVAEGGPSGKYPIHAMNTYWKWLLGDLIRLGKQELFLTELMIQFALCMQTPLSLQTLAKKTTIGSHNTVGEYVSILESCFALKQLHSIDLNTGSYRFKKDRKFYFTDPLLFWIAMNLAGKKKFDPFEEKLAEMVAHEQLSRENNRFGYHSNGKGEVDFIFPREWAIEVKWSSIASNLSKTYLDLRIPKKQVWTHSNFLEFP